MHHQTAAKLTRVIAIVLILYSLVWATAPYGPIDPPARFLLDLLAWPLGDGSPKWDENILWMSSIGAGLLMALGVIFLGVIVPAIDQGNRRVAQTTIVAMLLWFAIDSTGSIAAGFTANAVFNLITLVPILLPMVLIKWGDKA